MMAEMRAYEAARRASTTAADAVMQANEAAKEAARLWRLAVNAEEDALFRLAKEVGIPFSRLASFSFRREQQPEGGENA